MSVLNVVRKEQAPMVGLLPQDWSDAMSVQDACNLSGVVHAFSGVMPRIWQEVVRNGGGTDDVNRHPICIMYASKIESLTKLYDVAAFTAAYNAVVDKIKEHGAYAP